ncbi:MAG: helix-turn-helix domain-containing protein [Deltaproteobacteria bacterium]|nr:helix-turn-helix domain-containing protein [Deltaproteobacteria bacterium]
MDSLLTPKQVAEILNCKVKTVYSWAESGKIPCLKVNGILRFVPVEIKEWLEGFREKSEPKIQIRSKSLNDVSIDNIIKKAIADTNKTRYNSCQREARSKSRSQKGE